MKLTIFLLILFIILSCQKEKFTPKTKYTPEEDYEQKILKETDEILKKNKPVTRETETNDDFLYNQPAKMDTVNQILVKRANKYKKEGKYKKALNILLDLLRDDPKNISILENISVLYAKLSNFEASKEYAEKILKLNAENVFALTVIANYYAQKQDYEKAINQYLKLADLYPDYNILHNIGVLYEKQNKLKEAFKYYKKATRIKPSAEAYYSLAILADKMGDKENTLKYLLKASKRSNNLKIKKMLAREYIKQNKFEEAVKIYQKIINQTNSLEDYNNLASAYFMKKRYQDAEQIYKKALKYFPNDKKLLYNIALCYFKLKNPSKMLRAIKDYERAGASITKVRQLKVYLGKISK